MGDEKVARKTGIYLPMINDDPHSDMQLKMMAGKFSQNTSAAEKGALPWPG